MIHLYPQHLKQDAGGPQAGTLFLSYFLNILFVLACSSLERKKANVTMRAMVLRLYISIQSPESL